MLKNWKIVVASAIIALTGCSSIALHRPASTACKIFTEKEAELFLGEKPVNRKDEDRQTEGYVYTAASSCHFGIKDSQKWVAFEFQEFPDENIAQSGFESGKRANGYFPIMEEFLEFGDEGYIVKDKDGISPRYWVRVGSHVLNLNFMYANGPVNNAAEIFQAIQKNMKGNQ